MAAQMEVFLSFTRNALIFFLITLVLSLPEFGFGQAPQATDNADVSDFVRFRDQMFFLPWDGRINQLPVETLRSQINDCRICVGECKTRRCGQPPSMTVISPLVNLSVPMREYPLSQPFFIWLDCTVTATYSCYQSCTDNCTVLLVPFS